jgi:RNA polymerase sigma-70 factor (ECF subfamily)
LSAHPSEFATRVDELIPRLRRYARALTGERSAADDLVQDTLERAWTKLHLWRTGSDLRAWLFTIMHNVHVNQVRSRASAATLPLDDDVPEAPVRATQADMLEVRDIDSALGRLPVEQREVLLLVALEHMSYQQSAETLGIPIGTVMSRLARGRERLRIMLEGDAGMGLKVVK